MYKSIFYRGYFLRTVFTITLVGSFSLPGQAYQGEFYVPGNSHLSQVINPFEATGSHRHYAEKDKVHSSKHHKKDWKQRYESMTPVCRPNSGRNSTRKWVGMAASQKKIGTKKTGQKTGFFTVCPSLRAALQWRESAQTDHRPDHNLPPEK